MTPEELKKLKEDVDKLKDLFYRGDFPDRKEFSKKVVSNNKIIANGSGIKLTSTTNGGGVEIRTGSANSDASIIAEVGVLPNGSLYLSSAAAQPFLVKYNGTWTVVNLP